VQIPLVWLHILKATRPEAQSAWKQPMRVVPGQSLDLENYGEPESYSSGSNFR
jgi:hypothetical protein